MRMKTKSENKSRKILGKIGGILLTIALMYVLFCGNVHINTNTEVIEVGTKTSYEGISASFFGLDITKLGNQEGDVDTKTIGEYQISYKPFWFPKTYNKTVKVVDNTAPEITLKGNEVMVLTNINKFVEPGFEAFDNYDGEVTDKVKTECIKLQEKFYEIHYYVSDSYGNVGCAIRPISIEPGTVYLTFDDGPSKDITPEILKILNNYNVTATFFVVDYDESKEGLIRQEYMNGHTIGLHGKSHQYSEIYADLNTLLDNFNQLQERVKETTGGYEANIIRFPGGSSNTVSKQYCPGIMTEAIDRISEEGFIYFDWNVDAGDTGQAKNAEEVYQNVISGIREGRDNVILLHDSAKNTKMVEALPRIIEYCIEHGYEIKAITQDTNPVHHKVSN